MLILTAEQQNSRTADAINTLHLKGCIEGDRNLGLNNQLIRKNNLTNLFSLDPFPYWDCELDHRDQ